MVSCHSSLPLCLVVVNEKGSVYFCLYWNGVPVLILDAGEAMARTVVNEAVSGDAGGERQGMRGLWG